MSRSLRGTSGSCHGLGIGKLSVAPSNFGDDPAKSLGTYEKIEEDNVLVLVSLTSSHQLASAFCQSLLTVIADLYSTRFRVILTLIFWIPIRPFSTTIVILYNLCLSWKSSLLFRR